MNLEVVKKYYRLLFDKSSMGPVAKNLKMLMHFANMIEDEMPEFYEQTLQEILEKWDIIRYYEERQPIAVAIALIDDKIEEFLYSETDNKMKILKEVFKLYRQDEQAFVDNIFDLYFARYEVLRSSRGRKSKSKVANLEVENRGTRIKKSDSEPKTQQTQQKGQRAVRQGSRLYNINQMLEKIQQLKNKLSQLSQGQLPLSLNMLWNEAEEFLENEIKRIKDTYEKIKNNRNKQQQINIT